MKTLVLGLGNPILTDDGIGFYIIDNLKTLVKNNKVIFEKASVAGFNILELLFDFDKVIIIDAIKKGGKVGSVYQLSINDINQTLHTSTHDLGFRAVLDIGKKYYSDRMPKDLVIFGVEVKDTSTFSEKLTKELKKEIPNILAVILSEINLNDINPK